MGVSQRALSYLGGLAGSFLCTLLSAQNVGIGVPNPAEKLHVGGNLRFDGALMPGGVPGNPGDLLFSQGANQIPVWQDPDTLFWTLYGNVVDSAVDFIGTLNNAPFIIKVNQRCIWWHTFSPVKGTIQCSAPNWWQSTFSVIGAGGTLIGYPPFETANFIGIGQSNTLDSTIMCAIFHGGAHLIRGGRYNLIAGGFTNKIVNAPHGMGVLGDANAIVGGNHNTIQYGSANFIGGGSGNRILADSLPGGAQNANNVIAGGYHNVIASNQIGGTQGYNFIGGGYENAIYGGAYNVITGGFRNVIDSGACCFNVIAGGRELQIGAGNWNFVGSGWGGYLAGIYNFAGVMYNNDTIQASGAFVGNCGNCKITGTGPVVVWGSGVQVTGGVLLAGSNVQIQNPGGVVIAGRNIQVSRAMVLRGDVVTTSGADELSLAYGNGLHLDNSPRTVVWSSRATIPYPNCPTADTIKNAPMHFLIGIYQGPGLMNCQPYYHVGINIHPDSLPLNKGLTLPPVSPLGDVVANQYLTYSDLHLKDSIVPVDIHRMIQILDHIRTYVYLRKDTGGASYSEIGFLAREIADVFPEAVDTVYGSLLGYNLAEMIAVLWAVVQYQQNKIAQMEAQLQDAGILPPASNH